MIVSSGCGGAVVGRRPPWGPDSTTSPEHAGDEPLELASRLPGVPIVVDADSGRAVLGRPPENVRELLR